MKRLKKAPQNYTEWVCRCILLDIFYQLHKELSLLNKNRNKNNNRKTLGFYLTSYPKKKQSQGKLLVLIAFWLFWCLLAPAPALWGDTAEHPFFTLRYDTDPMVQEQWSWKQQQPHGHGSNRRRAGSGGKAGGDCKPLHRIYWQLLLKVTHQQRA